MRGIPKKGPTRNVREFSGILFGCLVQFLGLPAQSGPASSSLQAIFKHSCRLGGYCGQPFACRADVKASSFLGNFEEVQVQSIWAIYAHSEPTSGTDFCQLQLFRPFEIMFWSLGLRNRQTFSATATFQLFGNLGQYSGILCDVRIQHSASSGIFSTSESHF